MSFIKVPVFCLLLCVFFPAVAQEPVELYRIGFADKNGTPFSLSSPGAFLGPGSIERRQKQGIEADWYDLPLNPGYVDSLRHLGLLIYSRSRWMNAVVASLPASLQPEDLTVLSFVKDIQKVRSIPGKKKTIDKFYFPYTTALPAVPYDDYGIGSDQIRMLRGEVLHEKGFRGAGIHIAVADAGFSGADTLEVFAGTDIAGSRDFVERQNDVFHGSTHGMRVLSIMAADLPGQLTGTAPEASYWLFRSEDASTEYLVEEDLWVEAAEFADSLGVFIINTSLGYSVFDDPAMNHSYAGMDGRTTRISVAAGIAASRGMVVVVSAGNEGNKPWLYITAPADADSVLAVGAVDKTRQRAPFSSIGPSADQRVKPDVMAMGLQTAQIIPGGVPGYASGTSFSAPLIAGLSAALWQANPYATAMDLVRAIKQSSHLYPMPDTFYGYGIPDFALADFLLKAGNIPDPDSKNLCIVYPNPAGDKIVIRLHGHDGTIISDHGAAVRIEFFNLSGKPVHITELNTSGMLLPLISIPGLGFLEPGTYLLRISTSHGVYNTKLMKTSPQ